MIFYFSCTGNTLWAARECARVTGDRLIDMADASVLESDITLQPDERLGFCFPVHGWRPPKAVRNFISRMCIRTTGSTYCYVVCTAGDDIGETVDIFSRDLLVHGVRLNAALSLIMPESYVGLPFMDVDTPEKEKLKKERAAAHLQEFLRSVTARRVGVFNLVRGHWPRINSRILGAFFVRYLVTDKPFKVTDSKCLKCGKCTAACPVDNIRRDAEGFPVWRMDGSCLACFSCYHHCPVHAIEYGRRTRGKGQYYFDRRR